MPSRPATASVDPRHPCLVGVAQRTWHLGGDEQAPEPQAMAAHVVRAAAADADARRDVLAAIESLRFVYCMSWPYDDPPGRLAEALGIAPRHAYYSAIGGTVPQQLVSAAAADVAAGRLDVAVVVGAEALDTVRRLKKAGDRPAWSHRDPEKKPFPFESPFHPSEVAHEVFQAWLTFATRDVARRARVGVAPEEYRRRIGALLSPMTEIAADNPHAWFPVRRSADELVTPTPQNRLVGYPYTKYTISVMDVDMAAAVVIASHEAANDLGVPAERRVYLRGSAYATDPVYLAEHPALDRSPAMGHTFASALAQAGAGIDDIAHLDLYSCFASSVHFAADALGLDVTREARPLTVTGGLPYAGGAASNYLSHALTTMVGVLRADPGSLGLVSGVGMHMTKHIAAVYCTDPGGGFSAEAEAPSEPITVPIVETHAGQATIATYSVVHGSDGQPLWGLVVVDLPDGVSRTYGRVEDPDALARLEAEELVGAAVTLTPDGNVNRVTL
jgi:acetyl-CoA C-acetyltransferase